MSSREQDLERSWITNADAWTKSVREKQIESRKLVTDDAILKEIANYNPKKVLDVGCGEGWLSHRLSDSGIKVVGFDGSPVLIRTANEAHKGQFLNVNYDDFANNPSVVGDSFDVAVCNFSLLSSYITPLLHGLSTVLSSDGVIIIHTLHPFNVPSDKRYEDGWQEETFNGMGEGYAAVMPWYYRTMGSWLKELQKTGLHLVDCKEPIHPITGKPLSLMLVTRVD